MPTDDPQPDAGGAIPHLRSYDLVEAEALTARVRLKLSACEPLDMDEARYLLTCAEHYERVFLETAGHARTLEMDLADVRAERDRLHQLNTELQIRNGQHVTLREFAEAERDGLRAQLQQKSDALDGLKREYDAQCEEKLALRACVQQLTPPVIDPPPLPCTGNCPHCGAWVDFAQEAAIDALPAPPEDRP